MCIFSGCVFVLCAPEIFGRVRKFCFVCMCMCVIRLVRVRVCAVLFGVCVILFGACVFVLCARANFVLCVRLCASWLCVCS